MKDNKAFSKPVIIIGGVMLALIIFLPSFYFYQKYQRLKTTLSGSPGVNKSEAKDLVEKVGKLIELPSGEDPTIATVSDKSALPKQPFFAKAQNGDQVLIYTKAKKAFLYRPSTNKLIEVGPVSVNDLSPTPIATQEASISISPTVRVTDVITPAQTQKINVAIYNGSKVAGLAARTEPSLTEKFNNLNVTQKSNSQGDYSKTLVVDLKGTQAKLASEIAAFLKGEVGSLPSTETKPSADILVIVAE